MNVLTSFCTLKFVCSYPIIKRRIAWLIGKWVSEDSTSPRGSRRFWGSLSSRVAKQYTAQSFKSSTNGSAISSSKSERFLNSLQSMSPTYPRYASPSGESEGLFVKTKRNISTRRHLAVPFSRKKKAVCNDYFFVNVVG